MGIEAPVMDYPKVARQTCPAATPLSSPSRGPTETTGMQTRRRSSRPSGVARRGTPACRQDSPGLCARRRSRCPRQRCNDIAIEWPPRSGRTMHFPEIDRAAWFALPLAVKRFSQASGRFSIVLKRFRTILQGGTVGRHDLNLLQLSAA